MLLSLALLLLTAMVLSTLLNKLNLPGLLGMIATGMLLGPYALDLIAPEILAISGELRQVALIVILIRAGLSLDINDLKRVGLPAILMCFVPATLEIIAITFVAPLLLDVTYIEAAIMGSVVAAVSPAVVVPRMIHLIDQGYGKNHSIPQLVMAGASVDDIYVIVLFASFMDMYHGAAFRAVNLLRVPIAIALGLGLGVAVGYGMIWIFRHFHIRDTTKVIVLLCVAFIMMALEAVIKPYVPISGLLAIMALGATFLTRYEFLAVRLKQKFSKLWVGAEIILFVLVGAAVDLTYIPSAGISAVFLLLIALTARMFGVFISTHGTQLTSKEKLFSAIAYLPKATVQAAIGSIPLSQGVEAGDTILVVAVLAIIITAPIGAIGIDRGYPVLLDGPES